MKFAVLHPDFELQALLQAVRESPDQRILLGLVSTPEERPLFEAGEGVAEADGRWEELIHEAAADAVVMGGAGWGEKAAIADREERLRRLVQSGFPLICDHPPCEAILSFELRMIQNDVHGVVIPYFPGLHHPIVERIAGWFVNSAKSPVGPVLNISIQRRLGTADRLSVFRAFARDATFIRLWLGKIDRLSALRPNPQIPPDAANAWEGLSIQMADDQGRTVHWTLWSESSGDPELPAAELVLRGETATLRFTASRECPFRWQPLEEKGSSTETAETPGTAGRMELHRIVHLIHDPTGALAIWEHACRAMELADAIEPSARRGKTIQLFHEEHSEANTFKSVMAAGGCLSLLAILALIPFLAVLDRVIKSLGIEIGIRNLPWMVVAIVLIVFLSAQVMLLIAQRRDRE